MFFEHTDTNLYNMPPTLYKYVWTYHWHISFYLPPSTCYRLSPHREKSRTPPLPLFIYLLKKPFLRREGFLSPSTATPPQPNNNQFRWRGWCIHFLNLHCFCLFVKSRASPCPMDSPNINASLDTVSMFLKPSPCTAHANCTTNDCVNCTKNDRIDCTGNDRVNVNCARNACIEPSPKIIAITLLL